MKAAAADKLLIHKPSQSPLGALRSLMMDISFVVAPSLNSIL